VMSYVGNLFAKRGRALNILLFVLSTHAVVGQTLLDEFERGNGFYRNGEFERAVTVYEGILKQGQAGAALLFNLGNSQYRLGRIAPAILAYERARRLDPADPDIKHNLELVNLRIVDRIESLPELFFVQWLRSLSALLPLRSTALLFTLCWILFFGSLTAFYLFSAERFLRLMRWLALGSGILLLLFALLLSSQVFVLQVRDDAIVTGAVVTAKTSPDAQSVDAFVIHEGLRVTLSDAVGEWVKIVLADGKIGWIRSQECERI